MNVISFGQPDGGCPAGISLERFTERTRHILSRGTQFAEWHMSNLLLGRAPWTHNRFGQRYQAMCFADYKHLRNGNPEIGESLWMQRNLRDGNLVLDVGANHGIVSLECSLFVGPAGKVHAFEPAPGTRAYLLRHLQINDTDNVSVFGVAVGERMGSARLRIYEEATGIATLSESDPGHVADDVIEVETVTLDQHCDTYGIRTVDLLKIDIEGHELFALRGARHILADKRVRAILFEVGDRTCRNANVDPQELLSDLQRLGYGVYSIKRCGQVGERISQFPPTPNGQNFLAFPTP
jgi:FkbM family methyltransferase